MQMFGGGHLLECPRQAHSSQILEANIQSPVVFRWRSLSNNGLEGLQHPYKAIIQLRLVDKKKSPQNKTAFYVKCNNIEIYLLEWMYILVRALSL